MSMTAYNFNIIPTVIMRSLKQQKSYIYYIFRNIILSSLPLLSPAPTRIRYESSAVSYRFYSVCLDVSNTWVSSCVQVATV